MEIRKIEIKDRPNNSENPKKMDKEGYFPTVRDVILVRSAQRKDKSTHKQNPQIVVQLAIDIPGPVEEFLLTVSRCYK
jgi:hypothetical protein